MLLKQQKQSTTPTVGTPGHAGMSSHAAFTGDNGGDEQEMAQWMAMMEIWRGTDSREGLNGEQQVATISYAWLNTGGPMKRRIKALTLIVIGGVVAVLVFGGARGIGLERETSAALAAAMGLLVGFFLGRVIR